VDWNPKRRYMPKELFAAMLAGGHPNSLGRTVKVVDVVLGDQARLRELLDCYGSSDEVVRLRTSNALKRVDDVHHEWLLPYLDELIDVVGILDQPSAQWTMAQMFGRFNSELSVHQKKRALLVLQRNLV
jgi:Trp operon repressor